MKFLRKKGLITAPAVIFRGRASVRDIAYTYRMPAGFAGDINRTHPASVEACLPDPTNFPTFTGQACVIDSVTNLLRKVGVSDDHALTDIYGFAVRSYPTQQATGGMSASFGNAPLSASQPVDVLKSGYMMVPVLGTPVKGGQIHIWALPASGQHVPGGVETTATAGSTIDLPLNTYSFNGGPDANGICEIIVRA